MSAVFTVSLATTSDNTNSNAATNGQSLRTRRHWFAAKNPSRRSRTRSWTPHDTPPKEVPACCVKRKKKVPLKTLWSRRAKVLTRCRWSCRIGSWRRPIDVMVLTWPIPPAAPCFLQIARVEAFRKPAVDWSKQFRRLLAAPEPPLLAATAGSRRHKARPLRRLRAAAHRPPWPSCGLPASARPHPAGSSPRRSVLSAPTTWPGTSWARKILSSA